MYCDSVTVTQLAVTLALELNRFTESDKIPNHLRALKSLQYSKRLAKNTSQFLEAINDEMMTITEAFNGRG